MPSVRDALTSRLRAAGIQPAVIERLVSEIDDHVEDLIADLMANGATEQRAFDEACKRLGSPEAIAAIAGDHEQLKCWWRRYPRTALVVYPLACVAALPAVPVLTGVRHAALIGRWLSCLLAGGIVTATMLLVLNAALGV